MLDCQLSEEVNPPHKVTRSLARWGMWHEWTVTELSKKSFEAGEVSSSWREGLVSGDNVTCMKELPIKFLHLHKVMCGSEVPFENHHKVFGFF